MAQTRKTNSLATTPGLAPREASPFGYVSESLYGLTHTLPIFTPPLFIVILSSIERADGPFGTRQPLSLSCSSFSLLPPLPPARVPSRPLFRDVPPPIALSVRLGLFSETGTPLGEIDHLDGWEFARSWALENKEFPFPSDPPFSIPPFSGAAATPMGAPPRAHGTRSGPR